MPGEGLDTLWREVLRHREVTRSAGAFERTRAEQQVKWMWTMLEDRLLSRLTGDPGTRKLIADLEEKVRAGQTAATLAVEDILSRLEG